MECSYNNWSVLKCTMDDRQSNICVFVCFYEPRWGNKKHSPEYGQLNKWAVASGPLPH